MVALLAEGVDRNHAIALVIVSTAVALLAEGVDRNSLMTRRSPRYSASPSSRRAWIEISRKPSMTATTGSPSSRRAWIEIGKSEVGTPQG